MTKIYTVLRGLLIASSACLANSNAFADFGARHLRANAYGTVASSYCSMSTDGKYTVFQSNSDTLVPSTNNSNYQIFLYNRLTDGLSIVSRSSTPANAISDGTCDRPVVTPDGRYIAFESFATNFSDIDLDATRDIYVRDTVAATLTLVSTSAGGVAADLNSAKADLSSNGRYFVFSSVASNLASPCGSASKEQIYTKDLSTGAISCVSVASGIEGDRDSNSGLPAISKDGRYIVFGSFSTNLGAGRGVKGDVYLWDRQSSGLELISLTVAGGALGGAFDAQAAGPGSISDDGRYVAFTVTGGGGPSQVYLRDRQAPGAVMLLSGDSSDTPGNGNSRDPKIDSLGRFATFYSESDNFDIDAFIGGLFLKDLEDNSIQALDIEAPPDTRACISPDASTVSYSLFSSTWDFYQREQDTCPSDPAKENPGLCGCGVVDSFTDSDSDGTADCLDSCPTDATKLAPGSCGCGVADTDTDSDGTLDCNDLCPADPLKTTTGTCGCGVSDTDTNSNSIADCLLEADIKEKLNSTKTLLRKIKFASTTSKKRIMRTRVTSLKLLLTEIKRLSSGDIETKQPINFSKASDTTIKVVKKAFRYTDPSVTQKVKDGVKAITLLVAKIA